MSTATLNPDALAFICALVRSRSAIELDASKAYLINARLTPIARQYGFASTGELIQGIQTHQRPELECRVVEAVTTNETSFFRDRYPFEALQTQILPELLAIRGKQSLNIWSAACSTGQELYSVAMLLKEHFPHLAGWNVSLLGTDLSDEVLERARTARFSQVEVNRGLPAPLLVKYFQRDGMQWQLRPEVRSWASFRKLNLIEPWPAMPQMDVVFLRNVLIYFATDTKRQVLGKVRRVMAPHGVMFLGAAETTLNLDDSFERVQAGNAVYYRLKERTFGRHTP